MSITKITSTSGLVIGAKINSRTCFQNSNCIIIVIKILTIIINSIYKQHCASHAFVDAGLPKTNIQTNCLQS